MLPQKAKTEAVQTSSLSPSTIELSNHLRNNQFKALSDSVPATIIKAQEMPRVKEVARVAGEASVKRYIEFELIRLQALVNVANTLNDFQIQFVASQLFAEYPNESIADFKLCFERIAMGKYGSTYHQLDGIVIGTCMKQYLNEKYETIENELYREKDNPHKVFDLNEASVADYPLVDPQGNPVEVVDEESRKEWLKKWEASIKAIDAKPVSPLTDREVREEGQERPAPKHYPSTSANEIRERQIHIQYARENYDARTGKPLPNWMEENEWRKLNGYN